jgi:hypothetical protein
MEVPGSDLALGQLDRMLGCPQSHSGYANKEKNPFPYWKRNPVQPAHHLVIILTELAWLCTITAYFTDFYV